MAPFLPRLIWPTTILACVVALGAAEHPSATTEETELIHEAATALQRSLNGGNAIPASIMRRAQAIAVFPADPAEALVHEGSGVVSGRSAGSGGWLPAVVSFSATLRFMPGRRVGDILIIALTRSGFDRLAQSTFSLPRNTEIPPGPVGQNTTENMKTDFVAYGRYRRVFAGVALEQLAIEEDAEALRHLYGPGLGVREILHGQLRNGPPAALDWQTSVDVYFRELN